MAETKTETSGAGAKATEVSLLDDILAETKLKPSDDAYDVELRLVNADRDDPRSISNLYVRARPPADGYTSASYAVSEAGPYADAGPIAGFNRPFRRSTDGKSSAPEKFWSNPGCEWSITDPCAADSAWTGWDQPSAFFSIDPSCPAAKRPANAGHRHRLVSVPTEPVLAAFECAQA